MKPCLGRPIHWQGFCARAHARALSNLMVHGADLAAEAVGGQAQHMRRIHQVLQAVVAKPVRDQARDVLVLCTPALAAVSNGLKSPFILTAVRPCAAARLRQGVCHACTSNNSVRQAAMKMWTMRRLSTHYLALCQGNTESPENTVTNVASSARFDTLHLLDGRH